MSSKLPITNLVVLGLTCNRNVISIFISSFISYSYILKFQLNLADMSYFA